MHQSPILLQTDMKLFFSADTINGLRVKFKTQKSIPF